MLPTITPMIISFDEAPNIERTLSKLTWAKRIVVIDSGSTDQTLAILARHSNVEVFYRRFDSFAAQCNFGLSQVLTPWVLSLDADYVLSDSSIRELERLTVEPQVRGFQARFVYCVHGRTLRGALYPPRTVLHRVENSIYENVGHSHRVRVAGALGMLDAPIFHDDRKPLARWLDSQRRYAVQEAQYLVSIGEASRLSRTDRLRARGWFMPIAAMPYTLIVKRCALDGWAGWFYALQRTYAEILIALELIDLRISGKESGS
jgi:glycosyltransferase involved in cell wall biosynthesis